MPKLKYKKAGKRINIWIPAEHLKVLDQIENKSNFFQMAIDQAAGIMALDIIKREKQLHQPPPTPEVIREFNTNHPLDPLTAKRIGTDKWPKNSQQKPALW